MFVLFVMTVAAAEAAVGLAIIISIFRHQESVDVSNFSLLRRDLRACCRPSGAAVGTCMPPSRRRCSAIVGLLPLLPLADSLVNGALLGCAVAYTPWSADPSARPCRKPCAERSRRVRTSADHHRWRAIRTRPSRASSDRWCWCLSFALAVAIWLGMADSGRPRGAIRSDLLRAGPGTATCRCAGTPARSALDGHGARDHRRGLADPHLQRRLHEATIPDTRGSSRTSISSSSSCSCWCSAPATR